MSLMRTVLTLLPMTVLAIVWLGPLPALARQSFAAHMTMHMMVVAVAAPLMAIAIAGSGIDPMRRIRWAAAPIAASLAELVVVWGWHAPLMHAAARQHSWALALEQGSFLLAGLLLWVTALGGDSEHPRMRAASGVAALLFTSMHMTLLGALFALANRPLFHHLSAAGLDALADQHLGGAIMLIVGGASYLVGGLWLTQRVVRVDALRTAWRRGRAA